MMLGPLFLITMHGSVDFTFEDFEDVKNHPMMKEKLLLCFKKILEEEVLKGETQDQKEDGTLKTGHKALKGFDKGDESMFSKGFNEYMRTGLGILEVTLFLIELMKEVIDEGS